MRKEIGFVKGIEEKLNHLMGLLSILMIVGTMLTLALGLAVLGNYMVWGWLNVSLAYSWIGDAGIMGDSWILYVFD